MVTGIEHVGICAKDTVALKDWYMKVFGEKIVYDNGKNPPTFFVALADNSMLEVYPAMKEGTGAQDANIVSGIRHISISVDDFENDVQRFIDAGAQVVIPASEKNGVSTFFFRDPEGNIFHFIKREKPLI
ncbi:MAG: VOC family protein [Clostridia bacterium]|nr:VOC family protein [Clostridia bacterium]